VESGENRRSGVKTCVKYGGEKILEIIYSTFFVFLMRIFVNCICLACIVVILCVFVYLICICCNLCVFVVLCVYCCSYFICRTAG